ncbi:hypothetical protein CHUAL_008543 [Chamberlinius hualienensis]
MSFEQIQQFPVYLWTSIKSDVLNTLDANQSATVIDNLESKGNAEQLSFLSNRLREQLDITYIIKLIQKQLFSHSATEEKLLLSVADRYGPIEKWNRTIVKEIGPSIIRIHPSLLMQISDNLAMAQIFSYLINYLRKTTDQPEIIAQRYSVISLQLAESQYGPINKWKLVDQQSAAILPFIYPLNSKRLSSCAVINSTGLTSTIKFFDRGHAQPIIAMFVKNTNMTSLTKQTMSQLINNLGLLNRHLRVQDISSAPRVAIGDDVIDYIIKINGNRTMDKDLGKWLLSLSKPREDEWTIDEVKRLQPLLAFANGQLLSALAAKHFLDSSNIKDIFSHQQLDKTQLRAISPIATEAFKVDNQWDLNSIPGNLITIIPSDEWKNIKAEDIINQFDKLNLVVDRLSPSQIVIIAQKIKDISIKKLASLKTLPHGAFLQLISFDQNEVDEDGKKILINMPADSPQVQNYVNNKWDKVGNNVTTDIFRDDAIMLRSLSCEMLNKLDDENTMDLLEILSEAQCSLQTKTAICMADKLKRYLKRNRVDSKVADDQEETRLLSTLTTSQLHAIGGQLLIYFSPLALQEQMPKSRCQYIFALIGHVPLKTFNLLQPPEKKRQIARAALNCMDKPETTLNEVDAYIIGNLAGYVPETVLANMATAALIISLPYITGKTITEKDTCSLEQMTIHYTPPPCLTTGSRTNLRNKLTVSFGPPNYWGETELRSIGCLLSVLYAEQLNQISDEALLSVSDDLSKCWNEATTAEVYTNLCRKELPLSTTTMAAESNKLLKRRLATAALSRSRVTAESRFKRSSDVRRLSCDSVDLIGAALDEYELEEFQEMSDTEVVNCLADLGAVRIRRDKAIEIWKKYKRAVQKTAAEMEDITFIKMEYLVQALDETELAAINFTDIYIIDHFGSNDFNFTTRQLQVLAEKVLSDYKSDAKNWTSDDLMKFGYILCGFNEKYIEEIGHDVYENVSKSFKQFTSIIASCPIQVIQSLANKAKISYGDPSNWTSSTITTIGPTVGGLNGEEFGKIPGKSFEHFHESWIKTLPSTVIKVMTEDQLKNLTVLAAASFTQDQLDELDPKQMKVIHQTKGLKSRANLNYWPIYSLMLPLLMLTWTRNHFATKIIV